MNTILLRYFLLLLLTSLFITTFFTTMMSEILAFSTFLIFFPFLKTQIISNQIIINDTFSFTIVESCIAPAAYILISLIIFSMPNDFKKISKTFTSSILLFTLFNLLRICVLIVIFILFNENTFNKYHIIFYELLSGIITASILIITIKRFNLRGIPIISDVKTITKSYK